MLARKYRVGGPRLPSLTYKHISTNLWIFMDHNKYRGNHPHIQVRRHSTL